MTRRVCEKEYHLQREVAEFALSLVDCLRKYLLPAIQRHARALSLISRLVRGEIILKKRATRKMTKREREKKNLSRKEIYIYLRIMLFRLQLFVHVKAEVRDLRKSFQSADVLTSVQNKSHFHERRDAQRDDIAAQNAESGLLIA